MSFEDRLTVWDRNKVCDFLLPSIRRAPYDTVELIFYQSNNSLIRFANSNISDNLCIHNIRIRAKVIHNSRIGSACGVVSSQAEVDQLIRQAQENSLPCSVLDIAVFSPGEESSELAPEDPIPVSCRANAVLDICRTDESLKMSGFLSNELNVSAVVNSGGSFRYHAGNSSQLEIYAENSERTGFSSRLSAHFLDLDIEGATHEAVSKALCNISPDTVLPGLYPVILGSHAVAELLGFLSPALFSSNIIYKDRELSLGHAVASDLVTLWEDPYSRLGLPMPFDNRGNTRNRLCLVKDGILNQYVSDRKASERWGIPCTGHGLSVCDSLQPIQPHINFIPQPFHLFLTPGKETTEELFQRIPCGLYITRLNYTRLVSQIGTVVTGTTKGGTFLIKDGQVKGSIPNYRFTQSFQNSLLNVVGIDTKPSLIRTQFGASYVPSLFINDFHLIAEIQG
jgi:predicted Zn-dependent protease